jgi:hypothetical protein
VTDDLVKFLRARLDDDERDAQAVGYSTAEAVDGLWDSKFVQLRGSVTTYNTTELPADLAVHMARHDPARVLAEVDAKRRLLDKTHPELQWADSAAEGEWGNYQEAALDFLKIMALPYADHPDYRPEWAPEA